MTKAASSTATLTSLQKMQTTTTTAIPTMSAPSTKTPGLLRISAPHYCAGAEVIDGIVSGNVAPIIRYMRGWRIERVRSYCRQRQWQLLECGVDLADHHQKFAGEKNF
ncbi:hypothetical protein GGD67_003854 [Bradyrhizobium sp. IAR9]|uniref:hypothetical protein n=1 Tax=Bradyrhizobium sp. IAR9 TaxID=2663841 RepID=UPI0015C84CB1|nr:hypothetical protein [Bradyrhizobium sp. IAR9]NYG46383.1 hypothetical protein [Bradyrhizobium sp. IAR9]